MAAWAGLGIKAGEEFIAEFRPFTTLLLRYWGSVGRDVIFG